MSAEAILGKPAAAEAYPGRVQAWATVIILMLLYLTSMLDRNIVSLLGPYIQKDLVLTDIQMSYIYGLAFAVAQAIGALPFGWAIDRYSRRKVIWIGVTIWSLATMACGLSRNFIQLFIARAFVGAGEAVLVPGNQSILADMYPPERLGFPMSVYSLGGKFGSGFSLIIGGLMVALFAPAALFLLPFGELKGWQLIMVLVGLPGILIAGLIFLIPEPVRRRVVTDRPASAGYGVLAAYMWRNARFFFGMLMGSTLVAMLMGSVSAWNPTYFIRVHGMAADEVGYWLGLSILVLPVLMMPIHGLITDRMFRRGRGDAHMLYVAVIMLFAAVPFAAAYMVDSPWMAFALISVGFAAYGAYPALAPAAVQLMVPGEMRGKSAALLLMLTSVVGMSTGPTITAWVATGLFSDPMSIGLALAVCTGVGLPLMAFCFWLCCKPLAEAYRLRTA